MALLLAGLVVIAVVLGVAFVFLRDGDGVAATGVPSGVNVERVVVADQLGDRVRGISLDGAAILFTDDDQLCRFMIESRAVDCLEADGVGRLTITPGGGVWPIGAGPVFEDRSSFLLPPRVFDFDAGTTSELFDSENLPVRRPLDIDGDRLLLMEDQELVTTSLDGSERQVVTALSSLMTSSARLEGDVVVVANSDRDDGLAIERHTAEATVSVPIDSTNGILLDVASDFGHAIAFDVDAGVRFQPGVLIVVDFESRSTTTLIPPPGIDPTAPGSGGNSAWFSEQGDVLYALFSEFSDGDSEEVTLVAAELAQLQTNGGQVEWSVVDSRSGDNQPTPDRILSLAGMPSDGVGFLFVDEGAVYRMTPTYED